VLAGMPGLYPPADKFEALNAALSEYAHSREVQYVDLRQGLGNPPADSLFLPSDPVHPNVDGHQRMAAVLEPVLQNILNPSGRPQAASIPSLVTSAP